MGRRPVTGTAEVTVNNGTKSELMKKHGEISLLLAKFYHSSQWSQF